jgi:putative PIN family toxin of toxin-antitoxin system
VQVVADPNVLVSAVVTPGGVCAELLDRLVVSSLQLVVSPQLLDEVDRVLARPRFAAITPASRAAYVRYLERVGVVVDDPPAVGPPLVAADPGDDYLVRLTVAGDARLLVSGDAHLLALAGTVPVVAPRALLERLG